MIIRSTMLATLLVTSLVTAQAAITSTTYLQAEELTDWTSLLELQQFSPALGTLDSVTIELSATLSGSGGMENTHKQQAATFGVRHDGNLLLELPSVSTALAFSRSLVNQTVTLANYDNATDLAGSSGMNWTYTVRGNTSRSFADASQLAAFTGSGTVGATVSANAVWQIDGPSSRFADFDTAVSSRVTVTYAYSPMPSVPEPGTWVLLLAGLGAVGMLSARRRT